MRVVAAFDFDGTLTQRDTILPFLSSVVGLPRFAEGLPRALPALVARGLGRTGPTWTKEHLFTIYLRGQSASAVRVSAERFASERLPRLIREDALARLRWHRARGDRCIVVTASPEIYVMPWARAEGAETLGSPLEQDAKGHLTGRHLGLPCDGPVKADRLRALMRSDLVDFHAYGDSEGDQAMLGMARHAYFRVMPPPGET